VTWCHDIARDEAVRAAEDGRTRPLPTLEQWIAMLPKSDSATYQVDHENKGVRMTKSDRQAADYRAEASEREALAGMRTERVTLEVTHARASVATWDWTWVIAGPDTVDPESVRVVEDAVGSGVFDASGDEVPWEGVVAMLTAERDAAIREREELRRSFHRSEKSGTRLVAERDASLDREDGLRACVAELESQLESVACRAATAETVLEAASGGEEPEPVAWMCEWTDHTSIYQSRIYAESAADGDVVPQPLYLSPPQPRGWLTGEERGVIKRVRDHLFDTDQLEFTDIVTLAAILARSSPPEVVKPKRWDDMRSTIGDQRDAEWVAANAAIGVTVKEVGK